MLKQIPPPKALLATNAQLFGAAVHLISQRWMHETLQAPKEPSGVHLWRTELTRLEAATQEVIVEILKEISPDELQAKYVSRPRAFIGRSVATITFDHYKDGGAPLTYEIKHYTRNAGI